MKIVTLLFIVAFLGVFFYFSFLPFKATPIIVRKVSLLLFVVGLLSIELLLRSQGLLPGFTVSHERGCPFITIMPEDSLKVYNLLVSDSYGVNKYNCSHQFGYNVFPLNSDGFHSQHQFSKDAIDSAHVLGKQAILLLGDSWTYGIQADSGCSFADILDRNKKYRILNTGIPGMDIPQYAAVVKEYIASEKIKPDKVLVCLNRNDINQIPTRKITPGVPLLYYTNAGALYSFIPSEDTVFASAKESYRYILNQYTLVGILGTGWWTNVVGKSVLACRLLGGLFNSNPNNCTFCSNDSAETKSRIDQTTSLIREIENDCRKMNISVVFILLPSKYADGKEDLTSLIEAGVTPLDPNSFLLSDYPSGWDDHPNNNGHKKLADQLDKILSLPN